MTPHCSLQTRKEHYGRFTVDGRLLGRSWCRHRHSTVSAAAGTTTTTGAAATAATTTTAWLIRQLARFIKTHGNTLKSLDISCLHLSAADRSLLGRAFRAPHGMPLAHQLSFSCVAPGALLARLQPADFPNLQQLELCVPARAVHACHAQIAALSQLRALTFEDMMVQVDNPYGWILCEHLSPLTGLTKLELSSNESNIWQHSVVSCRCSSCAACMIILATRVC